MTSSHDTVTRSDAAPSVTPVLDLQKGVGEEEADSLSLLIVFAACGALIAGLGDLP